MWFQHRWNTPYTPQEEEKQPDENKKVILSVLAGIVIAGAIIAWLMLSGDKPITVKPGDGVTAQINASLKNSMVKREKDGKKLWEFTVEEVVNDKAKTQPI